MNKRILFFLTGILFFTIACEKVSTEQQTLEIDGAYFPLTQGLWREYEVSFIEVDAPSQFYDTSHYYLREVYNGFFIGINGDTLTTIQRFVRDSLHHKWSTESVWYAQLTDKRAIQVEENIRFLKLVFPLELDKEWYGDAYNRLDTINEFNYRVASINTPETINNMAFDSVLTIMQKDKSTLIDKIQYYEKYARNIGVVERVQKVIYSEDLVDPSIPIERRVTRGTLYEQKITGYGKLNSE